MGDRHGRYTRDMSESDDKLSEPIRRKLSVADPAEHLQQLVDTALDAVITCDSRSRITVWNSGAERLFGWSTEEAIGLRLHRPLTLERTCHKRQWG